MALKQFALTSLSESIASKMAAEFDADTLIVAITLPTGSSAEERTAFCRAVDEATNYELRFEIIGDVARFSRKLQR